LWYAAAIILSAAICLLITVALSFSPAILSGGLATCTNLVCCPLQLAMSGDHAAMVRVSHMLLVGYGTRQDEGAAANWMRKAW
jgi:TPR repeat protein